MPSRGAVGCLQEDSSMRSRLDPDPDHISSIELDKRFQELSAVLRRARDSFSCRLEEEQANPLKELRTRLLKAKERFHSRLANVSRFQDPGGFYPAEHENPFQELRSVLRSARLNFVPLLDQYILDNSGSSWDSKSNAYDGNPEQESSSTLFDEDRDRPRPIDELENTESHLDDESPSRLHWLLEQETRSRRRSKLQSSRALQPQTREEGHKNVAPPAPGSSARLDVLINEELDRKRASGTPLQHLRVRSIRTNCRNSFASGSHD